MTSEVDDKLLSAWIDDELSEAEVKELKRRLRDEPALAKRLELLSKASSSLKSYFSYSAQASVVADDVKEDFIRTTFSGEAPNGSAQIRGFSRSLSHRGLIALGVLAATLCGWLVMRYVAAEREDADHKTRFLGAIVRTLDPDAALEMTVTTLLGREGDEVVMRARQAATGQWSIIGFSTLGLPQELRRPTDHLAVATSSLPARLSFDGRRLWAAPTKTHALVWRSWDEEREDGGVLLRVAEVIAPSPTLAADRKLWEAATKALLKARSEGSSELPSPVMETIGGAKALRCDLNLGALDGIVRIWVSADDRGELKRIAFGSWRLDFHSEAERLAAPPEGYTWESVDLPAGLTIEPL